VSHDTTKAGQGEFTPLPGPEGMPGACGRCGEVERIAVSEVHQGKPEHANRKAFCRGCGAMWWWRDPDAKPLLARVKAESDGRVPLLIAVLRAARALCEAWEEGDTVREVEASRKLVAATERAKGIQAP
jgi:hypothetical protein